MTFENSILTLLTWLPTLGAAILLISEDLEEILALSDRILVMSKGRLSTPSARGERSVAQLGELMAGHGMETAA